MRREEKSWTGWAILGFLALVPLRVLFFTPGASASGIDMDSPAQEPVLMEVRQGPAEVEEDEALD